MSSDAHIYAVVNTHHHTPNKCVIFKKKKDNRKKMEMESYWVSELRALRELRLPYDMGNVQSQQQEVSPLPSGGNVTVNG